ncbi:MAG: glycosyltransferase family 9 protein [Alphaproteobacteria bacterium]|nr:glycosyltransferase family 9 protein [Alphaproteobacteria bacterium]
MNKRILIYRLGSLGDTLAALPALKLVARAFPDAERWMLTNFSVSAKAAPMAAVLADMGLVHGYIEYPIGMRSPRALWALRTRLRASGADTLVYLTASRGRWRTWRDALFFRACGIRRLVGVPYRNDQREVRRLTDGLHEYEGARLARCVSALGDARIDDPASYDLALTADEIGQADRALSALHGRRLINVSIGTKADARDWEDARWRPLLDRLASRYPDAGLVLDGARSEFGRCEALAVSWAGRYVNLCGTLSVRASAAALMRSDVFIGHNSGPMHLAAAVGTRCVAIFASNYRPGEWFPHGQGHHVLYTRIACEGCRLDVCVEKNKACIRSISVAAVEQAVAEVVDAAQDPVKVQQHAQCQERS